MNSLGDIRIFLGLVPKESPCISQIISISWFFIYAELLCRAFRHDLILIDWFVILHGEGGDCRSRKIDQLVLCRK
jgi:hypothetical protein